MTRSPLIVAGAAALTIALTSCAHVTHTSSSTSSASGPSTVTITNCGARRAFPSHARRVFVNDSNMVAMMLSIGAGDQIVAATGIKGQTDALAKIYGHRAVSALPDSDGSYPTLEQVLGARPDVMLAGYGYGYGESTHLTPEELRARGISAYVLSESCRAKSDDKARGVMDPWTALRSDLSNLGTVTGHTQEARRVVKDIDTRRRALARAPQASTKPTVLMVDSGDTGSVFTSGRYGGPEGIIKAAGAVSATTDVANTWTTISWEKIAQTRPDVIVFDDYPGQTMAQKVALLEANPATKNLPAVKNRRFVNIAYPAWTSSPLNVDAAETLRQSLEKYRMVPASGIKPRHDVTARG